MFIKVLPLDISFDKEGLTYFIKDEQKKYLEIGSLVSIPIKDKISYGVVSSFEDSTDFEEVRSIVDLVCSFPIVNQYEIKLIFRLANRYFLPVHKVLNLFFPKFIFNRFEKNAFEDTYDLHIPDTEKSASHKIEFIHNISGNEIDAIVLGILEDKKSKVIIFPDDFSVDIFLEKFNQSGKKALVYKNSLTYAKKYDIFLKVLAGENNILIGTRKILQYNLARYSEIIYIEDSLQKYNYNQYDKFKNLDILKYMIEEDVFDFRFISTVPSIEIFDMSKKYNFEYKVI